MLHIVVWRSNNKWSILFRESLNQGEIIIDAFSLQLSVLSRQVGDLQADNLKLYEKIRFLQVIAENYIK